MKLKIFNRCPLIALVCLLSISMSCLAQGTPPAPPSVNNDEIYQVAKNDITATENTTLAPENTGTGINYGFKSPDSNLSPAVKAPDNLTEKLKTKGITEKTKNYSKTYSVTGDDLISISNSFGRVTVITWTKNEVQVDAVITIGTGNDDKTQKLLDNVNISDGRDANGVYFKTTINNKENNGSWWSWLSSKTTTRKMEINYTVYMPAKNPLAINNTYGSINLPDLEGKVTINSSFGNLTAKTLSNPGNQLNSKYGNVQIDALGGSDINVDFGNLTLGDCDKINGNFSYTSVSIGHIKTSGNINIKFGDGVHIQNADKNLKSLSVNASYANVRIGLPDDLNADFDVNVKYGSFDFNSHNISITNKNPADDKHGLNLSKSYKGYTGKGSTEKTIAVNASFSSVKFE